MLKIAYFLLWIEEISAQVLPYDMSEKKLRGPFFRFPF